MNEIPKENPPPSSALTSRPGTSEAQCATLLEQLGTGRCTVRRQRQRLGIETSGVRSALWYAWLWIR